MELRQLRYLIEVATAGSIGRASENLCISQSAVSRQIADLESELGVVLLQRQRGGGALTDAGQRFVEGSAGILASLEALRHAVCATVQEPQLLRVGLPPTVSPVLQRLMVQELPDAALPIRPSVVEASSHWLRHHLDSADIDCAVLTNPVSSRSLQVEPLWHEQLFLVGIGNRSFAPKLELTLHEIGEIQLTLTPRGDPSRDAIEAAFAAQGISPHVAHEHEAVNLLRELIMQGVTHSILSQTVVRTMPTNPRLVAIPVQGLTIARALAVRRGALPKDLIERLAQRIRVTAQDHFREQGWVAT